MLVTDGLRVRYVHSSSCTRKQQRKLFHDFTTYFVGELEKNFVEMGDAEVPFVVGQLRHHQLGKRGLSTVGKHVDVTGMQPMLLLCCCPH